MTVDLERCVVEANGETYPFEIEARAREGLLEGLDAIGMTLCSADRIAAFGNRYRANLPWNAEPTRPLPTT